MFEKYFSPEPKVFFSFTEQEHAKGGTFHVAPIQTSFDYFPVGSSAAVVTIPVGVIRKDTVFEHLKSLLFLLKY